MTDDDNWAEKNFLASLDRVKAGDASKIRAVRRLAVTLAMGHAGLTLLEDGQPWASLPPEDQREFERKLRLCMHVDDDDAS